MAGDRGAQELAAAGRAFKAMSGTELRKELLRGIRASNKPTISKIRESASSTLPRQGGLAALVANSSIGTRTRLSGANAGVEIKGTGKSVRSLKQLNEGTLRHPIFGRAPWAPQRVSPGFFSDPIEADLPQIRSSIEQAMNDVAAKLESSV